MHYITEAKKENEFSEKKIIVEDVKRNNTIYDGKNLILIDPDLFYFSNRNTNKNLYKTIDFFNFNLYNKQRK